MGLGFLKVFRKNPATQRAAFIILTAQGDKELAKKAATLGANNILAKPFTIAKMKAAIEAVFGALLNMNSKSKKINIIQGEYQVSDDEEVVFSTILGSCIAACLRDPVVGVGGINHFLLPGSAGGGEGGASARYGVHLMELLINGLLKKGASRKRIEAKIIGGGKTVPGLSDIGEKKRNFC